MENFIKNLARGAGKILREGFRTKFKVSQKTATWDVVTEYDLAAEKFIVDKIKKKYPSHGILSEETGQLGGKKNVWVIDPLDGTLAFVRGVSNQFGTALVSCKQIAFTSIHIPNILLVCGQLQRHFK